MNGQNGFHVIQRETLTRNQILDFGDQEMELIFNASRSVKTCLTAKYGASLENMCIDFIQSGKHVHRFYRVYATRRVISPISPCYLV